MTIIGAFLASKGYIDVVILYFIALAGDFVGDFLHYAFGRWFWKRTAEPIQEVAMPLVEEVEHNHSFIAKTIGYIGENTGKAIVFAKWTHVACFAVLLGAGAAKVPLPKFFWYCFLGTAPKLVILILIGYTFGSAYNQIYAYIGTGSAIMFAIFSVMAIIVAWTLYSRSKQK